MIFVATKTVGYQIFSPPFLLLFFDLGYEIQDLGSGMYKNRDPGSGINILDPQH